MILDVTFVGLNKLGTDTVAGLTLIPDAHESDPSLIEQVEGREYYCKKWTGKIGLNDVEVREFFQLTQNNGLRMLVFSALHVKDSRSERSEANWVETSLLPNVLSEYDYTKGQINFR